MSEICIFENNDLRLLYEPQIPGFATLSLPEENLKFMMNAFPVHTSKGYNMQGRYQTKDQNPIPFFTFAVLEWVALFYPERICQSSST